MDESTSLLKTNISSTINDSIAVLKLQKHLKEKQCGCCFNVQPLINAEMIHTREMSGYISYLWTLIEDRWTTEDYAPYYGDEPLLNNPLGDIWNDYQFTAPTETIIPNQKTIKKYQDIKDTQEKRRCWKCECHGHIQCPTCEGYGHVKCMQCKEESQIKCCTKETCIKCSGKGSYLCDTCKGHGKYDCDKCLSHGKIECPTCKGQCFVVVWSIIHVKWYNIKSSITHKPDIQCILPSSEIERAPDKVTCLVHDSPWSSTMDSIDTVLDRCVGLPQDFRNKINQTYRNEHCGESGKILQIHCVVQRLKIKEFEYKLDHIEGRKKSFL